MTIRLKINQKSKNAAGIFYYPTIMYSTCQKTFFMVQIKRMPITFSSTILILTLSSFMDCIMNHNNKYDITQYLLFLNAVL